MQIDSFSPKQIAEALNVSESSVKRWCDRGVIRTDRTLGGHRRILLEGLMEFLESTNRRLIHPSAIGMLSADQSLKGVFRTPKLSTIQESKDRIDKSSLLEQFERALVSGTEVEARKIVSTWYSTYRSMVSIADELIFPCFQAIGTNWECGRLEVYQERRGCEICVRLLHELRRLSPEPTENAPIAMGATPSGDSYQIANQLLEVVFRECGWRTMCLGSNLPFESLSVAVKQYSPRIFWLSVSHLPNKTAFIDQLNTFANTLPKGTLLVVGGRAIDESIRPLLRSAVYCDNMQQMSTLAVAVREGASDARIESHRPN